MKWTNIYFCLPVAMENRCSTGGNSTSVPHRHEPFVGSRLPPKCLMLKPWRRRTHTGATGLRGLGANPVLNWAAKLEAP